MTLFKLGLMTCFMSLCVACSSGKMKLSDARHIVLEDMTQTMIIPELNELSDKSVSFNNAIQTFTSTPTLSGLQEVQRQWKDLQKQWQLTQAFQFGPAKNKGIKDDLQFWPKRKSAIDSIISNSEELTQIYVTNLGVAQKGLPVIEYLIFDHENDTPHTLNQLTTETRRLTYLSQLGIDIVQSVTTLKEEWRTDGKNYADMLINSTDGLNMVINQLVSLVENIRQQKIGKPLGKHAKGSARSGLVESQESETSVQHVYANIEGIQRLFEGSEYSKGLYGYLSYRHQEHLGLQIKAQLTQILDQINTISGPLWKNVTENPEPIEVLYDQLTELLRFIKVDMAIAINETIHFSDSDGD